MMHHISLRHRPRQFRSLTGLEVGEFDRLAALIRTDWIIQRALRLSRPHRKRREGAGRKYALPELEDQLLLTLVWSRLYLSYLIMEYLFGCDESTVYRTIQRIQPLLQDRFMLPERLPKKKITTLEELREFLPDINFEEILGDATEQKTLRPKDKRKRRRFHSGKKHAFTLKTQIAVTARQFILDVSDSVGGRMHDYRLFQRSHLPQSIPKGCPSYFDNGYQGVQNDFPGLDARLPFKRHRGKKTLSRSEKIRNKKQRRARIPVENALAQLKKFTVLAQTYRHSVPNYNQTFRFVANVLNFRMLCRGLA